MGTPTYSIPAWMYKEHPEIVVTRLDGQTITYGLRQNTDLMNPTYRFYCERVIRKIAGALQRQSRGHRLSNRQRNLVGGAANHDVQVGFREYLSKVQDRRRTEQRLGSELLGPAAE